MNIYIDKPLTVERRGYERSALIMRGNTIVAEVFNERAEWESHYKNAALMAAAPTLLAALIEMLKYAEGYEDEDHVIAARAAIAAATGEGQS